MSKKRHDRHITEHQEAQFDFDDAKELTVGEAMLKNEEVEAGVLPGDSILDKYVKQHKDEIEAGDCMDLDIIRQEIDQIDDQIVKLLEERMHLVEGVVAYKKASGKPILDTKREAVIFEKVRSRVGDKRYQETIVATFSDILKRSRDYQDQNIK